MPEVEVVVYREDDGTIPLQDWLESLQVEARIRCVERIALLARMGHELRRPYAEHLAGTNLYELRVKFYRVNFRMLYFFHERTVAVVTSGFAKERLISKGEINLATARMVNFKANPGRHTAPEEG